MAYLFYTLRDFFDDRGIQRFLKYYIPSVLVLIYFRYQAFTTWSWREFQTDYSLGYYAIPFFLTTVVAGFSRNKLSDKKFWIFSIAAILVLQINHFVRLFDYFFYDSFSPGTATYFMRLSYNAQCIVSYLAIPVLFFVFGKKEIDSFWGLNFKKPILKPYFLILVSVMPVLWLASLAPHFRSVYPLFLTASPDILSRYSLLEAFVLFQLFYVFQFVCLEIFFRGFMVLKGKEFVGKYSVFLMTTVYVLIHLEAKPMMESVGSLFGGLVLGAIAYQTRQIWGGILVHVGIALAMELLALV